MAKQGLYYNLVESQQQDKADGGAKDPVLESAGHVSISVDAAKSPSAQVSCCQSAADGDVDLQFDLEQVDVSAATRTATHNRVQSSSVLLRLLQYNRPEWGYIFMGAFGSFLIGVSMPTYAVVYGEVVGILGEPDADQVRRQNVFYCFMFLIIAAGS